MKQRHNGFTLLELVVVLGIVMILTAMALPKFLTVRIRSQVVVARSHTQTLAQALDLYTLDFHRYPGSIPRVPSDPLGILSSHQLTVLTSPISYVTPEAFNDPFGVVEAQLYDPNLSSGNDFPKLGQPNSLRSLLYFHYLSLAERNSKPFLGIDGASVISIGPDRKDSLGVYRPFAPDFFFGQITQDFPAHPYDTVYQPTNGVRSGGDIGGYAGGATEVLGPMKRYLFCLLVWWMGTAGAVDVISGMTPQHSVTADFNGDGLIDLAVANAFDDTVAIHLQTIRGCFPISRSLQVGINPTPPSNFPRFLAVEDTNRDGAPDLIVLCSGQFSLNAKPSVQSLFNDRTGAFQRMPAQPTTSSFTEEEFPVQFAQGEFTGDVYSDLVICNLGWKEPPYSRGKRNRAVRTRPGDWNRYHGGRYPGCRCFRSRLGWA